MRVLCIKIISPVTREEVLEHPGVQLDLEYDVLSILVESGRGAKFRIRTDDGTPALFDAAMFAAAADKIPRNWVMSVREGGLVSFGPARWLQPGFWERYFDGDPEAVAVFKSESDDDLFD